MWDFSVERQDRDAGHTLHVRIVPFPGIHGNQLCPWPRTDASTAILIENRLDRNRLAQESTDLPEIHAGDLRDF